MDRGAWWATVQGVTKSWTWLKWLSTHAHLLNLCCWWCLQFEGSLNITKQWWLLIFSYLFLKTPVGPATRKTLAYKSIFPFKISPPRYWMYSKSSWLLLAKPRFKICLYRCHPAPPQQDPLWLGLWADPGLVSFRHSLPFPHSALFQGGEGGVLTFVDDISKTSVSYAFWLGRGKRNWGLFPLHPLYLKLPKHKLQHRNLPIFHKSLFFPTSVLWSVTLKHSLPEKS